MSETSHFGHRMCLTTDINNHSLLYILSTLLSVNVRGRERTTFDCMQNWSEIFIWEWTSNPVFTGGCSCACLYLSLFFTTQRAHQIWKSLAGDTELERANGLYKMCTCTSCVFWNGGLHYHMHVFFFFVSWHYSRVKKKYLKWTSTCVCCVWQPDTMFQTAKWHKSLNQGVKQISWGSVLVKDLPVVYNQLQSASMWQHIKTSEDGFSLVHTICQIGITEGHNRRNAE